MNRRRLVLGHLVLTLGLLTCLHAPAFAQAQLNNVRGLDDADKIRPAVGQFLQQQVQRLTLEDPAQQASARDTLVTEASGSAIFLDVYSASLNQSLLPLMKNENVRVRLNAAIVAARVAEAAQNMRLRDMALAAMGDKAEPVVLWGLRIAGNVIPTLLQVQNPQNQGVLRTVAAVVKQHTSSLTVQYAYRALMLDILNQNRRLQGQALLRAVPLVVPEMQEIFELRINQYRNSVPPDPMLEARFPVLFLTEASVWRAQKEDQRLRTVQLLVNLMSSAAQRAAMVPEQRDVLAMVVGRAAASLQVAGAAWDMPQVKEIVAPAASLPRSPSEQQILQAVESVPGQLRALPKLSTLKDPPRVEAAVIEVQDPTAPEPAEGEANGEKTAPPPEPATP